MTQTPANLPTLEPIEAAPKPLIGFIGQGFIGKNYADDLERRGYACVRYSLEPEHVGNKDVIRDCGIVFIAVPTPTTPEGFSSKIVEEALLLVGIGKIAVIKSTIVPGTTARLQRSFPAATILYSPEFLSEKTAATDAAHPFSNIVGMPVDNVRHREAAQRVLEVLPLARHTQLCTSTEAELIKYSHNLNGYWQIMLSNILYDTAQSLDARWSEVQLALEHDPMISNRYIKPVHQSGFGGAKLGRGAGGHCFIKDFAAFRDLYAQLQPEDVRGMALLAAIEDKNVELLRESGKDLDLLEDVYGTTRQPSKILPVIVRKVRLVPSFGRLDYVVLVVGALVILIGLVDLGTMLAAIL